ncbi:MAG: 50S ribosomal protein L2, partial [Candidatus Omnitrophota bacterium]|nr:50S ribosomal protein L2 [Candidatus Omnitrophota bacterium]
MCIKKYRPTTPSRRWMSGHDFSEITKKEPEKSLTLPLKRTGGRNVYGR